MNERGASAIEFVLILPILLPILFGIIEYGWVMKTKIDLNNAVSEGARAVVKEKDADPPAVAEAAIAEVIGDTAGYTSVTSLSDPSRVRVEISGWPFISLTGFLPSSMLPATLSSRAVMAFP